MRLLDLRLDKFGPFTDYTLDLSAPGVHVIYGPNEAGKSSTLRAITHFFYGFPSRTSDDHLHRKNTLRVGATISTSNISTSNMPTSNEDSLALYRKKGNKGTLRDESDQTVDDLTLATLLSNLPRDQFITFFGLDSKTLVAGGEDLIKGQGNLGEALFSAGMGGQQFQQLIKELDARQNELFKSTGSNPKLNVAFKALKSADALHKQHCLKSTEWEKAHRLVEEATEALASITSKHKAFYLKKERLERIRRTLPNLSSRTDLVSKLNEIENVPTLPQDSSTTRLNALSNIKRCQSAIQQQNQDILNCESQLANISINERVLAQDIAIDALKQERALYRNNIDEFQLAQGETTEKENELKTLIADLSPKNPNKNPEELILTTVTREKLGLLIEEGTAIESYLSRVETKQKENTHQLAEAEEMLEELPEKFAMDDLPLAIKSAERALITEQDVDKLTQLLRELQKTTTDTICRLSLIPLNDNQLLTLVIPSNENIIARKTAHERQIEEHERITLSLKDIDSEISNLKFQQKEATVGGQLISENDLFRARKGRDSLWLEIKNDWIEKTTNEPNKTLTIANYETQTSAADQYADRLRREADQLAEYGLQEIQLEKLTDKRHQQQTTLHNINNGLAVSAEEWQALWPAEVASPGSYAEMLQWEISFRQLQVAVTEKIKLNANIEDKAPHIENAINTLTSLLAQSGEFTTTNANIDTNTHKPLSFLLELANALLTKHSQIKDERQSHLTRQKDAQKLKTKLSHEIAELNQEKKQWQQRWTKQIIVLEVPSDSSIHTVTIQLSLFDQLAKLLKEHDQIDTKRNQLKVQINRFENTVAKLISECGITDKNPQDTLINLHSLLEALTITQTNKRNVQTIRTTIKRHQSTLASEIQQLKTEQDQLAALFQLAGCETTEELQLIETENTNRADLRKSLATIEKTLKAESYTITELYTEIEGINIDELPLMINEAIAELKELEQKKELAIKNETTAISEFNTLENQEGAVTAAEDAESALAQIDVHYREYCMLAITRQLLSEQIESYREQNQGPILALAETYFCRISLGRYPRLVTQYNDKDEPELYCVRGDREIPINGLSEGTRDQLFFCLRIASILHYFDHHDPIPLIIDDIMMTFDDERSLVAFQILGELAEKTQVLYFTHHSHHKDLARGALKEACVFHDLEVTAAI